MEFLFKFHSKKWKTFWMNTRFYDGHCKEFLAFLYRRKVVSKANVKNIFNNISTTEDYEVWCKILCFEERIHYIVHSTKIQAYDLYAPSTMASDDHSSVSLSTSKRRLVFFAAIDVSRRCALSALIMYDMIFKFQFW